MNKGKWKKYLPIVITAVVFGIGGFAAKATADGSLPHYVGCKL